MSRALVAQYKCTHTRKTMFAGREMLAYNVPGTLEAGGLAMAQAQPEPLTYAVVVRDPNSWSASTGIHLELANCGHHHRTIEAAQHCLEKLTAWRCLCGRTTKSYAPCCHTPHNSTSARWYHARVEDSNGNRIDAD